MIPCAVSLGGAGFGALVQFGPVTGCRLRITCLSARFARDGCAAFGTGLPYARPSASGTDAHRQSRFDRRARLLSVDKNKVVRRLAARSNQPQGTADGAVKVPASALLCSSARLQGAASAWPACLPRRFARGGGPAAREMRRPASRKACASLRAFAGQVHPGSQRVGLC